MKSPDKPELAKSIALACRYDPMDSKIPKKSSQVQYVIDGGALLHRIPWTKGETYTTIFHRYYTYINER